MKTMHKTFLTVCAAGTALFLSTSANANLVVNGDFETGNDGGWTFTPASSGSVFQVSSSVSANGESLNAHDGTYSAFFGANLGVNDTISQNLTTTAGQSYQISFWVSGNDSSAFEADWNGSAIYSIINVGTFGWTQHSFVEQATSSSTRLAFGGQNAPHWVGLDDVSVSVVPETSPCVVGALLLLPLGASSLRMLRKARVA